MSEIFMNWRPDFNLGIDVVDKQHKKIIELINQLNEAYINNESQKKLSMVLDEMDQYADYHFRKEEELFSNCSYPFYEEHIHYHENFRKKVSQFKIQSSGGYQVTQKVLDYLKSWFTNHILDVDREYVDIIKSEKF